MPGHWIANLSAGYRTGAWSLTAYVQNLADRRDVADRQGHQRADDVEPVRRRVEQGAEALAQQWRALGLDAGARVAIAHRGVFGGKDPIAVLIGRMTVALRRVHARAMTVRQL